MDCEAGTPIIVDMVPLDGTPWSDTTLGQIVDVAGTVAVGARCDEQACAGFIVVLPVGATTGRETRLPHSEIGWFADGFALLGLGREDLDGDGSAEILVRYQVTEAPRAAVGSWLTEWLVIYDATGERQVFTHRLAERGGESEHACSWQVGRAESGLRVEGRCAERHLLESGGAVEVVAPTCWRPGRRGKYRRC